MLSYYWGLQKKPSHQNQENIFPSTIREWNNLSTDAQAALSMEIFKSRLKSKINLNKTYLWHNVSASINLSRIRMGLSVLNQQHKAFHFITSGNCPLCNAVTESVSHYFLHCPNFAAPRREMLQDLNDVLPEPTHNLKEINLMELILYGTRNCNVNINLFDAVRKYIAKSERFI